MCRLKKKGVDISDGAGSAALLLEREYKFKGKITPHTFKELMQKISTERTDAPVKLGLNACTLQDNIPDGTYNNTFVPSGIRVSVLKLHKGITRMSTYFIRSNALKNVHLPNTVTTIGESAFEGCDAVTLTSLPSTLTTMEEYAFQNCKRLFLTTLPGTLKSIDNGAFKNCLTFNDIRHQPIVNPSPKKATPKLSNAIKSAIEKDTMSRLPTRKITLKQDAHALLGL